LLNMMWAYLYKQAIFVMFQIFIYTDVVSLLLKMKPRDGYCACT
jgi:hypothetical protein